MTTLKPKGTRLELIARLREVRGDQEMQRLIAMWVKPTFATLGMLGPGEEFEQNSHWQEDAIKTFQSWDAALEDEAIEKIIAEYELVAQSQDQRNLFRDAAKINEEIANIMAAH